MIETTQPTHNDTKTRLDIAGETYYIQLQGQSLYPLFQQREDYSVFLNCLANAAHQECTQVLAYCLLNQSIHLLIRSPVESPSQHSTYTFMRQLNSEYTQYYNEQQQRHGSVFQAQFSCTLIEPQHYLAKAIAMLHRLPIQYGLVAHASIYPWSSHNDYLSHNQEKRVWLDTTTGLQLIAKQRSAQQRHYQNFIDHAPQHELDAIDWNHGHHPHYFALASQRYIDGLGLDTPAAATKKPTLALLTLAVCREYGMKPRELLQQQRHRLRLDVCAQVVSLAQDWNIAEKDKSCRFLDCDEDIIEGTLRRLDAESGNRSHQLKSKLSRQLNVTGDTRPNAETSTISDTEIKNSPQERTAQKITAAELTDY